MRYLTILLLALALAFGACTDNSEPLPDDQIACEGMDDFHYTFDDDDVEFLTCTYWCEGTTDPEYQSTWVRTDGLPWELFDEISNTCE